MVGAYEYDWRIGRIEKKFYGVWMGSREVKMLTEVFLCDDARDEKRLTNVPGEMAERLLRNDFFAIRRASFSSDVIPHFRTFSTAILRRFGINGHMQAARPTPTSYACFWRMFKS